MAADALYDAVLGALTLKQITRGSFNWNSSPVAGYQSGMLDVTEYFGGPADPRARFSSTDVGGVVGGVSATAGLSVSAGTISIPFQKRSNQSTFAGSGSHNKLTAANGLIVPLTISASQDGDATADLECIVRSADGTNPVTISSSQSLSGLAFNGLWTVGPVVINSQTIDEVASVSINYGIGTTIRRFGGLNFPQKVYVVTRRPTIDITFFDYNELSGFLAAHTAMTSAVVYLRQRSGATFAATDSGTHCSFSFGDGMAQVEMLEASNESDGTCTIRLYGETISHSATANLP